MTGPEMTALALHLVIGHINDWFCSWEYVPELNGDEFEWLVAEIEDVTNDLRLRLAEHEHRFQVNAAAIAERVS